MNDAGTIRIHLNNIVEFTGVIAGLVKEGIIFNAQIEGSDWVIHLTGGF